MQIQGNGLPYRIRNKITINLKLLVVITCNILWLEAYTCWEFTEK